MKFITCFFNYFNNDFGHSTSSMKNTGQALELALANRVPIVINNPAGNIFTPPSLFKH